MVEEGRSKLKKEGRSIHRGGKYDILYVFTLLLSRIILL